MPKKVLKLLHWGSSHNLFWRNLHRHIALCFDSGYTARSVNYAEKVLRNCLIGVHLITLFGVNLHRYWCIALSFDSGYAARIVNYADKKVF
jgi:hypothetical protein